MRSQFQYEDVVAEQAAVDGLVVVRALYGDLSQIQRYIDTEVEVLTDISYALCCNNVTHDFFVPAEHSRCD